MTDKTDDPITTEPNSGLSRWATAFGFWFQKRRGKRAHNNFIHQLLSEDKRVLEDIGVPRSELVRELGYDPYQLSFLQAGPLLRIPNSSANSEMKMNHAKRYRSYYW